MQQTRSMSNGPFLIDTQGVIYMGQQSESSKGPSNPVPSMPESRIGKSAFDRMVYHFGNPALPEQKQLETAKKDQKRKAKALYQKVLPKLPDVMEIYEFVQDSE